jgi:hypothetical protein
MHEIIVATWMIVSRLACTTCQPADETDCGFAYTFKDMKIVVRYDNTS